MNHQFVRVLAIVTFAQLLTTVSQAQLVQVGPGLVKAPFVRVFWCPDGSSRVRAPFVDVVSAPRRMAWGASNQQLATNDKSVADMDWRELSASLRRSASTLDAELGRFRTADLWKVELQTAEIRALTSGDAAPPTPAKQDEAAAILRKYTATREKPADESIFNLPAFQMVEAALREFVTPPAVRLQRQLLAAAANLDRSLDQLQTAKSWQNYLALPVSVGQLDGVPHPTAADVADLQRVLERFNHVGQKDEFRAASRLPEFQTTKDRLAAYLAMVSHPSSGPTPSGEELPLPTPQKPNQ